MQKRVRLCYLKAKQELCDKGDDKLVDRFSELPDEILACILSRLTVKEAAMTSILSRRWKLQWLFTTCINFDVDNALKRSGKEQQLLINCLDSALEQHISPINEFKICFASDKKMATTIARWIKWAMTKKVQSLEDDFFFYEYPSQLGNLKHLHVKFRRSIEDSLVAVTYLTEACPNLESFVLEALVYETVGSPREWEYDDVECTEDYHQHLKVVKLIGYDGGAHYFDLAMYFINYAVSLEKMIVDPSTPKQKPVKYPHPIPRPKVIQIDEAASRSRAKEQFKDKIPQRIEFLLF